MRWIKYHFLPLVLFRLRLREHGAVVVCHLRDIPIYFEDCQDVHSVKIEMVFMTEAQYDKMPEFSGF